MLENIFEPDESKSQRENTDDSQGTPQDTEAGDQLRAELLNVFYSQLYKIKSLGTSILVDDWRQLMESGSIYSSDRLRVFILLFEDKYEPFISFFKNHFKEVLSYLNNEEKLHLLQSFLSLSENNRQWIENNWVAVMKPFTFGGREMNEALVDAIFASDEEAASWAQRVLINSDKYNAPRGTAFYLVKRLVEQDEEHKQWVLENVDHIKEMANLNFWYDFTLLLVANGETKWLESKLATDKSISLAAGDIFLALAHVGETEIILNNWRNVWINKRDLELPEGKIVEVFTHLVEHDDKQEILNQLEDVFSLLKDLHAVDLGKNLISLGQVDWVIDHWRIIIHNSSLTGFIKDELLNAVKEAAGNKAHLYFRLLFGQTKLRN